MKTSYSGNERVKTSTLAIVLYLAAAVTAIIAIFMTISALSSIAQSFKNYGTTISSNPGQAFQYIVNQALPYYLWTLVLAALARIVKRLDAIKAARFKPGRNAVMNAADHPAAVTREEREAKKAAKKEARERQEAERAEKLAKEKEERREKQAAKKAAKIEKYSSSAEETDNAALEAAEPSEETVPEAHDIQEESADVTAEEK